eukprot:SAG31_NODE_1836_length_7126_cov_8.436175_7_plen_105_part_00
MVWMQLTGAVAGVHDSTAATKFVDTAADSSLAWPNRHLFLKPAFVPLHRHLLRAARSRRRLCCAAHMVARTAHHPRKDAHRAQPGRSPRATVVYDPAAWCVGSE